MLKRAVLKTKSEQPDYSIETIQAMLNIFFNQMTTLKNKYNYKGIGHFEIKNKNKSRRKITRMQYEDGPYAYIVFERNCMGRECLLLGLHLAWKNYGLKKQRSENMVSSCLWFARGECKIKEVNFRFKTYFERKKKGWKFV